MTILIDHEQRRVCILEHAFALFAESGYDDVTYQKIADRCGISRTSIYKYFHNKEQIFNYAIKFSTGKINAMIEKVLDRKDWSPKEKIIRILHITAKMLADSQTFLAVILNYILSQRTRGTDVRSKVRRYTYGMKHLLEKLLGDAVRSYELNVPNPEIAAGHLYGMLESFVLNLTVTDMLDVRDCIGLIDSYIEQLTQSLGRQQELPLR